MQIILYLKAVQFFLCYDWELIHYITFLIILFYFISQFSFFVKKKGEIIESTFDNIKQQINKILQAFKSEF